MNHNVNKTYYISIECQSNEVGTIRVEALNELEAKGKAFEIFAGYMLDNSYDVYVDTEEPNVKPDMYLDENGEEIGDEQLKEIDIDLLIDELNKNSKSTSVYDGDQTYVEVRYPEEIDTVKKVITKLGYEIDRESWSTGSDYEAYYIWLK